MCGICGQYNFGSSRPVERSDIEANDQKPQSIGARTMRGTTSLDRWDSVFAGFRLLILRAAISPCRIEEESVWVVFNGEIYNFLELRRELEGLRSRFPHEVGHRSHHPRIQAVGR